MDTSDPDIEFDADGVCNHCHRGGRLLARLPRSDDEAQRALAAMSRRIKADGDGHEYDAVIGLSGGVDSSYAAYLAREQGLRVLAVHFDNGWNSELAVENIQRVVEGCGLDLQTYVINWLEFRDLQRSFLKASVIDIELLTDHAIFAAMFGIARERKISTTISGSNVATEHGIPTAWTWDKKDWTNIKAIHDEFGSVRLKTFPHMGTLQWGAITVLGRGLRVVEPLNLTRYRRDRAAETLQREFGWREYGGKHHESLFTKFYQGYILPTKFGVDKRRAHLSDRMRNGELTRDEALAAIAEPPYPPQELANEREFVLKKLGFSDAEFGAIMATPPRSHADYRSDRWLVSALRAAYAPLRWLRVARGSREGMAAR